MTSTCPNNTCRVGQAKRTHQNCYGFVGFTASRLNPTYPRAHFETGYKHNHRTLGNSQRGFSLVTAIFVLVILAVIGAYMITIGGTQLMTVSYATQGVRATEAARAGAEWGIYQAINTALGAMCSLDPATFTTGPFAIGGNGLEGFQATVDCTYTTHTETSNTYQVFRITSTATSGTYGNPDYYSRTVYATVTNAP